MAGIAYLNDDNPHMLHTLTLTSQSSHDLTTADADVELGISVSVSAAGKNWVQWGLEGGEGAGSKT